MRPLKIGLVAGALALSSVAVVAQGVDLRPENSIPKYERGPTSNDNAPYRGGTYKRTMSAVAMTVAAMTAPATTRSRSARRSGSRAATASPRSTRPAGAAMPG
jgi:hypothetical protein